MGGGEAEELGGRQIMKSDLCFRSIALVAVWRVDCKQRKTEPGKRVTRVLQ